MSGDRSVSGGLYLVIDPIEGAPVVLPKVEAAIRGGVEALQIWNHWARGQDEAAFVGQTLELAHPRGIPVLVHERPDLLRLMPVDGIHYDAPDATPRDIRKLAGRDVLYGLTCSNDLERIGWASREGADYVSFCSLFPSPSAGECELVSLETVSVARALCGLTIFGSGGITPRNARSVLEAGADGVAVISGILGADDPETAAREYASALEPA